MVFESTVPGEKGFLMTALSELTGTEIKKGLITLPESFGNGYIKSFDLGPFIYMMIHQYELKQDVTLKKAGATAGKDLITFSFRNVFQQHTKASARTARMLPSVLLSSGDLDLEIFAPAGTRINTILITVKASLLKHLLNKKEGNVLLENILSGNQSYLYDEIISPEIENIAADIVGANTPEQLSDFYLKLKATEMIYLFFVDLLKRQNIASYPLNAADAKVMYQIRDKLISNLNTPPDLSHLASFSNMSESKMNRLFKQIFGNSIYNYYQIVRMNEAAYLIKEEKLSVSEAGYRMGFSNLSHFTRIFERHIGLKPKKYSAQAN